MENAKRKINTTTPEELGNKSKRPKNFDLSQDKFTADGLRKTLHGNVYQLGLLTLAAIRAQAKGYDFNLISEAKEFKKFDDLVIDYGNKIIYLQAKHSSSEKTAFYSKQDFCGDYKSDASLAKYFDSWHRLRNYKYKKSKEDEAMERTAQYVFFTNKGVKNASTFLKETKFDGDEFLFNDLETKTYGIKPDKETRSEFIDAILASSKKVRSNPADINLDQNDFDLLKNEITKAKEYLEKKFNKQNGESSKEIINISKENWHSKLSVKVLALIKLAIEKESVAKIVLGNNSQVLRWLHEQKQIVPNISNPLHVLAQTSESIKNMIPEINTFLDEFIVKIEQPNSQDLAQIIIKELGKDIAIMGTIELNNALNSYMWEWFSNRSECLLRSDNFGNFIEVTKGDLNRFCLLQGTWAYKEECKNIFDLVESRHFALVEGLSDFLNEENRDSNGRIAVFKDQGGGPKLQVYSVILSMSSLKDDEWSFLCLSDPNLDLLPEILTGKSSKFYIVDCRSEETNDEKLQTLGEICQITLKNKKKLILLIRDKKSEELTNSLLNSEGNSSSIVKFESQPLTCQQIRDACNVHGGNIVEFESQPLTNQQIKDICSSHEGKYLSLAGREYRIQEIIDNKIGGIYELMSDAKYLLETIKSLYDEKREVESEIPYGVYISNQMRKGEGYYSLSIITKKTANCYIVQDADYKKLCKQLRDVFADDAEFDESDKRLSIVIEETGFVLLKNADDLDEYESQILILTENPSSGKLGDKTYISLKILDNERFQIIENPNNLYLPDPEGIDFSNTDEQEQFIQTIISGSQLSVLMSPAGYGKTSFCKNLAKTCKSFPLWIIRIPLPKLQFDTKSRPNLSSFLQIDYEWQEVALEKDEKVSGRVLLILDGFDEVKNSESVKLINQWISTIPKSVSMLITTREYASYKLVLPTGKNSTFYKLTKFTKEQRKEYIKKFLKAILEAREESEEFKGFVEYITEKMQSKVNSHSRGVLDIPLESYIFCELLRPHILTQVKQNSYILKENIIDVLENIDVGNSAKLYQEFILAKSRLFLEKHLGINPENIVQKSVLFNLMGSYNQIIELNALKQAFDLNDMDLMENCANIINFDVNELKTLEDTGLLRVSKDGGRLNFNHETYQEFYAALAIIRGIVSDKGELYETVQSLVRKHRYDPKFRFIFSTASQFSVSAGAMVPGYSIEKHLLSFWNILGEDGDILGAGAINLFKRCISEFTSVEREMLLSRIEGKKWAKFLKVAISCGEHGYEELQICDGQDRLPISSHQGEVDSCGDVDEEINMSKEYVAGEFRRRRKKENYQDYVKLLEIEAEKHKNFGDYWALDGGIEAIGYSGQFFSKNLAYYLMLRASQWPNNKRLVIQALKSIYRDIEANKNCNDAKANCFSVVKSLLKNRVGEKKNDLLLKLLYVVDFDFLDYLIDDLSQLLSTDKHKTFQRFLKWNHPPLITVWFETIRFILLVAKKLMYAVLIDESENKIFLIKDKKIEINFNKYTNTISEIFGSSMLNLLRIIYESNKTERCDDITLDESNVKQIEKNIFVQLKNEELFDILFDSLKDNGTKLLKLYQKLSEYESVTSHCVKKYIAELKTSKATEIDARWSICGGIEVAGYTGIYFNREIAEYLIVRSGFWPNNRTKAIEALKRIHDTLNDPSINESQKVYPIAVKAYNQCIENFSALDLVKLKNI
ncbi:uncharacterized protein LOC136035655 [Artemia franciscana]|uniref:uncharacterized protein LOC136035655 n=1 Tax=Artemia franciscana TaxID=6661 RepID=UPI0032DA987E